MRKYNKKGFTLIELLISLAILIIITPIVYLVLVDFSKGIYEDDIKIKSLTSSMVVNNIVSGLVKNSYGIKYTNIDLWTDLDTLVLYTDKLEQNFISIYVKQDLDKDISRVYINKWWTEVPLHSTDLFIEKFNFKTSPEPIGSLVDITPWVSLELSWRTRSPLEEPTEDQYYDMYNRSETSFYGGRWIIRNYVPSSWKY